MNELPLSQDYTDLLLPVSAWPSLNVYYVVWQDAAKEGRAELRIGFVFDDSRYTISDTVDATAAQQNAIDDLAIYTTTRDLLKRATGVQPDTKIIVTTSLFGQPSIILAAEQCQVMIDFATQVCEYLQAQTNDDAGGEAATPPKEAALCFEITPALLNTKDIFEVEVQLEIQRDIETVEQELPGIAGVCDVASSIMPPASRNDTGIDTIAGFAAAFEKALALPGTQVIKLAGTMDETMGRIWAVRWGMKEGDANWYKIIEAPVYFAIPPLANITVSRPGVPVCSYITGKGLDSKDVTAISFTGVDMDAWGRIFTNAMEAVLSPVYMVPAAIAGKFEGREIDYVQLLEDAKAGIAASIAASVTNVFIDQQPSAGQVNSAAACVKEQCLTDLRNAYLMDAFVQFPVKVSSGYIGDDAPLLYGNVRDVAERYSLPAAGILLKDSKQPGDQYLTVAFSGNNFTDTDLVQADLSFQPTHILYTTDKGLPDSKGRLEFLIPPAASRTAQVSIPVMLKYCPVAPVPVSQAAKAQDIVTTIDEGKKWNYEFIYYCDHFMQDEVLVSLPFNVTPLPGTQFSNDGKQDLFEALAQFVTVYPAIKKDLDTYLTQVTMQTTKSDAAYINGIAALQAFTGCVQQVATAWKTWKEEINPVPSPGIHAGFSVDFVVRESASDGNMAVQLSPEETGIDGIEMPVIQIDPGNFEAVQESSSLIYQYREINQPTQLLSWVAGAKITERTVCTGPLDILKFKNAQAALSIRRNARFDNMATNGVFVYTTPYARFADALLPLLECNVPIDASVDGKTASLAEQIAGILEAIFNNDVAVSEVINMSCAYSYSINPALSPVMIPVMLARDIDLNLPVTQTLADSIAMVLHDWFNMNKPSTDSGMFVFEVTVFPGLEGERSLPLLRFGNLQLAVGKINDLGEG